MAYLDARGRADPQIALRYKPAFFKTIDGANTVRSPLVLTSAKSVSCSAFPQSEDIWSSRRRGARIEGRTNATKS